jgi:DNA processing protein
MPLQHWLQLALTDGIGPILIGRLTEGTGGAEQASAATVAQLRSIEGIGPAKAQKIHDALRTSREKVKAELDRAAELGVTLISRDHADYPLLLTNIPDPPPVLYVMGSFEPRDLHAVAIVGSRKCTYYGREQADRFAALLAGAGVTVVSGGARGVDSAAHRGALSHPQGRTIAVLGSGIDVPYPAENEPLFAQIAARAAVVSEYPLGTAPLKENFPRRNRIVSGMSRGVLVVEADERSGALITARQACDDHGRSVFAIPGRIDNPLSAGPHRLIRDGATLVTGIEDVLEGLSPLPDNASRLPATPALPAELFDEPAPVETIANAVVLTDRQSQILAHLSNDPAGVDQIIERSGLDAPAVLQELTMLSLKGVVRRIDGQTYARRGSPR